MEFMFQVCVSFIFHLVSSQYNKSFVHLILWELQIFFIQQSKPSLYKLFDNKTIWDIWSASNGVKWLNIFLFCNQSNLLLFYYKKFEPLPYLFNAVLEFSLNNPFSENGLVVCLLSNSVVNMTFRNFQEIRSQIKWEKI